MIAAGERTMDHLRDEITFTRYRGGTLSGYLSRLHYTAEWISDNITKEVVADVTPELGGVPLDVNVYFMSQNPQYYKPLTNNPAWIARIAQIEERINATPRTYIPKDKIKGMEGGLRSGDIIAVATNKAGLDYSHTGLINVINGEAHFMHASSTMKKVVIGDTISTYVNSVKAHTGITVVRPL
jgi:hypothetical protein